jgi:P27 family predicted phage terminase small subunit
MPGPKPKPTALKVLEGNPGKQKLPKNEPRPRPLRPTCPAFLGDRARSIWDSLVDELEAVGVLTAVDESDFAAFCQAYAEAQECELYIQEHGLTFQTSTGYWQQRPEVGIRNKAWDRVDKFGAQLGIGAAHRSRIEVKKRDGEDSPFAELLAQSKDRRRGR